MGLTEFYIQIFHFTWLAICFFSSIFISFVVVVASAAAAAVVFLLSFLFLFTVFTLSPFLCAFSSWGFIYSFMLPGRMTPPYPFVILPVSWGTSQSPLLCLKLYFTCWSRFSPPLPTSHNSGHSLSLTINNDSYCHLLIGTLNPPGRSPTSFMLYFESWAS